MAQGIKNSAVSITLSNRERFSNYYTSYIFLRKLIGLLVPRSFGAARPNFFPNFLLEPPTTRKQKNPPKRLELKFDRNSSHLSPSGCSKNFPQTSVYSRFLNFGVQKFSQKSEYPFFLKKGADNQSIQITKRWLQRLAELIRNTIHKFIIQETFFDVFMSAAFVFLIFFYFPFFKRRNEETNKLDQEK